jgi:la-related protein 1
MAPAGMPGVPMAPPFQYSVPFQNYQGSPNMSYPYQMPGIYTLPTYYVMQPPSMGSSGMGASQPPFMPGGMPQGAPQSMAPTLDRTTVVNQARSQVEHYFSMENLLKDMCLRKNMDQEGWVNIHMIAEWPQMKKIIINQDPSILVEAITTSQIVEVDPSQTRLRLRRDWEKWVVPGSQSSSPPMQPGAASLPPPMRPPV